MLCDIPNEVARAIDLGACARYAGAPTDDGRPLYGLEGHSKRGRFAFHCQAELIPLLIRDIDAAAAKSQISKFRELCETATASLRAELEARDTPRPSYIWPMKNADGTTANGG